LRGADRAVVVVERLTVDDVAIVIRYRGMTFLTPTVVVVVDGTIVTVLFTPMLFCCPFCCSIDTVIPVIAY